mgnify:CR=1 FL=1
MVVCVKRPILQVSQADGRFTHQDSSYTCRFPQLATLLSCYPAKGNTTSYIL